MKTQINGSLEGKRIIILGGSKGIGLATAIAADKEGANVVIVSSNPDRVNEALALLSERSDGYAVDLSHEENIKDFFAKAGKFDHLVYTAGENIQLDTMEKSDITKMRNFFNVRYWGVFAAVKYGAPNINEGGSINLTGGIAGLRPGSSWAIAASICGAMDSFVKALAVELAPIRVNNVSPGVIRTNLWDSMNEADREQFYQNVGNSLLTKRIGEPEDIALAFIYLMKQRFGTGQSLVIDGGAVLV